MLEDLCFWECSPLFPGREKFEEVFGDDPVLLVEVVDGPEFHGQPVRRTRWRGAVINLRTVTYHGPQQIAFEFGSMFHATAHLNGSAYFQDSDDAYLKECVHCATTQGFRLTAQQLGNLKVTDFLLTQMSAGHFQRFEKYRAAANEKNHVLICDTEHHMGHGPSASHFFPTQLTHGTVWKFEPGQCPRRATCFEHLQAQGFNLLDSSHSLSSWVPVLGQLSSRQAKLLSGNGQHCKVEAAFMLYILGHCERRPTSTMPSPPQAMPSSSEGA